jgi:hypothetical protein
MAYKKILFRRDTAADWTSENPILSEGEVGYETDTGYWKIGDGSTAWSSLAYEFNQDVSTLGAPSFQSVTIATSPSSSTHAATKAYVDSYASGINWHEPAYLATAAILPNSPSYDNGTSGSGATLTGTTNGRLLVDGANASTGDRILVKDQADNTQNGVYVVSNQGSVSSVYVITRSTDFNAEASIGEINKGEAIYVINGSTNAGQGFTVSSTGTGTGSAHQVGTDAITFYQFTGTSSFIAGNGLSTTGNTVNVGTASSSRIVIQADDIDLATVARGDTSTSPGKTFVASVTSDSYGRVTGVVTGDTAITLGTDTSGDYVSSLVAGTGVTILNNGGESASPTIAIGQAVGTSASVTFALTTTDVVGTVSDISNHSIDGLGDVSISLASGGEVLMYNAASGIWINDQIAQISSVNDISDVNISTPGEGDFLKYTGTEWVNEGITLGEDTIGNYMLDVVPGTGVTVSHTPGEGSSASIEIGQDVSTTASVSFAQVETTGDVIVGGDLHIHGTTTTVNETNLAIEDTFIYLNDGSTTSNPDLGWAGNYNDGTYQHAGLFRDATDGKFKFFDSYTPEPTDPINTAHASYSAAPVVAEVFESTVSTGTAPISVSSSTVVTNLNSDKLDGQDGDYYAPADIVQNAQTGNYTLVLSDRNKMIEMNVGSGNTLTVPTNASVAFPVGTQIVILQTGAGQTTVSGGGVTINGTPGTKLRAQWSSATLIKRATDTWVLTGDLSA